MGRDLALLTDRLDDAEIESRALRRESRRRDGEDVDGLDLEELTALAGRLEVATARVEAARARALADVEAARRRAAVSEDLLCPISFEVMSDPVILADGHSYERAAIEQWLARNATSPVTGLPLAHVHLTPNIALRKAIESLSRELGRA